MDDSLDESFDGFEPEVVEPQVKQEVKKSKKHKHKKTKSVKGTSNKLYHSVNEEGMLVDDEILDSVDTAKEVLDLGGITDFEGKEKKAKKSKKKDKSKGKGETSGSVKHKKDRKRTEGGEDGEEEEANEEERWLNAIETGNLEEVDDELRRIRNPRLLTARQRAMFEKQRTTPLDMEEEMSVEETPPPPLSESFSSSSLSPLMALPSGFKEKVLTQEMMEKKAIKSQKRRVQALEKREEDKQKTVDRLLKKQDSKLLRTSGSGKKNLKSEMPMLSFRQTASGVTLSLPNGWDYPINSSVAKSPPPVKKCGIPGCENPKIYSHRNGLPLCSLQCYKLVT